MGFLLHEFATSRIPVIKHKNNNKNVIYTFIMTHTLDGALEIQIKGDF